MVIGRRLIDMDTPCLWVDLDRMERNIQNLAGTMRQRGVAWRPHTKGIKVPAIAHRLIDAGAIGVTCAKLGEAEVMAAAGIKDILIANQIIGEEKIARLVNLRRQVDVMVAVDDPENVAALASAARAKGVTQRVLVEVNTGMNRCGVDPGEAVVRLSREVSETHGLQYAGLMGWEGHVVGLADPLEKERRCRESVGALVHSAELCRESGLSVPIVSCGGSGTYMITSRIPGVTEIQAGGAVFCDVAYRTWGVDLEWSLFVQATVVSRPHPCRAVVDAGRKAMNGEAVMPLVDGTAGAQLIALHAEHGIVELAGLEVPLRVGDKMRFVVGYGDNTVYLHDQLYGVRGDRVEVVWDIQGRGRLT